MSNVVDKPQTKSSLVEQAINPMSCSFCDKTHREVKKLAAREGNFPAICDECVAICVGLMGPGAPT